MKTGINDTKLIDAKHKFTIGGTQFESIHTIPGLSDGFPSGEFSSKHSRTKSNRVTNIENGVKSVPYQFKFTGKLSVRNRIRECTTGSVLLWFCFLVLLIMANVYILKMLEKRCQTYDHAITLLETVVTQLEKKTLDLENSLTVLRLHYRSSAMNTQKLPSDSVVASKRWKRSDGEVPSDPKDRKRNRRYRTRSRETVAVQFSGSKPYGFTMVPPEGILGPWIESTNDLCNLEKFGATLNDRNSTLEINRDGLYIVYAQVTYQSINVSNSYSVIVITNTDEARSQPITTCSSFGKIVQDGEISCYTSVVTRLSMGDVLYVQQAQPNREIIFSKTYTHFGLIFLMT